MLRTRVIPCLLLRGEALVKTVRFRDPAYIGDPVNTVRIFNEFEVDELVLLDIAATPEGKPPDFALLERIAGECFMPLAYGGGIRSLGEVRRILSLGFEKVVVNTSAAERPDFIRECADAIGSQSVVVSIDVRRALLGGREVRIASGTRAHRPSPEDWAKTVEELGAGEILLTSIDREGTWKGYDLDLLRSVTSATGVPVIANGGAGSLDDVEAAVKTAGASAAALGSMVVYQKRGMGVLVNFPDRAELERRLP
jgi:cyclase